MNINKSFKSNYLRAVDIEGENLTVTIDEIREEEVGQDKDTKPVVYFKEVEVGLVLNKTNANTITQVLGTPETDEWIGRQITLYPTEVPFGDKMVESIRVRLRAPRGAAQAQTQAPAPVAAPRRGVGVSVAADDVPVAFLLALFASTYFVLSATTSILS